MTSNFTTAHGFTARSVIPQSRYAGYSGRTGFTLIELLVVVLIIGILAAVALPQYQKAVVKSKNAEMKQVVQAIAQAEHAYYLEHGRYAANFNELDIDLPLSPVQTSIGGVTGACNTDTAGTDSSREADDYYVVLNNSSGIMNRVGVVAYWRKGRYKCAGFGIAFNDSGLEHLHCREMKSYYTAGIGNFCKQVESGTELPVSNTYWRYYRLP